MSGFVSNLKQSWQESMAPLRQRWLLLAPREQQMLRLLSAFGALLLLVYGIWLPSRHAAENAQRQYESNRELLMQLQASGGVVHDTAAMGGSLLGNVSAAAGNSNLALSRIEPEGDNQVRVWVEKADFNAVARWLAVLSSQGLHLQEAQVEKQSEGGGVSGRLVLVR